ncbi:hypothetical protein [Oleispirillum naphthae]|uniref:hypothetical protein n=1 Tax=Oleispirillum naphthae TaxID=2838853 RepID=UPI0030822324
MNRLLRWMRPLALLLVLAAAPVLSSCYVPDQFRAEIRIARNGDFSLSYDGVLTWAQIYIDIRNGKLKGPEIQEKIEAVRRDLKRDTQFTEVRSLGAGQFAVKYRRTGNLAANTGMMTFIRRNARILDIISETNGRVTVAAQTPNRDKLQPLAEAGLMVRGSLRLATDMRVVAKPNATAAYEDKESGWTVYDWIIDGTKPVYPFAVFQR